MPVRPPIAPSLTCHDVDKTYDYFTSVLGFAGNGKMPAPPEMGMGDATMHAEVAIETKAGAVHIMLGPYQMMVNMPDGGDFAANLPKGPLGNGVNLYLNVPDVDKYYAFVKQNGAMIDEEPKDQFWGDRTMSVTTPDGYLLTFSSPIKGFKMPKEMVEAMHGHVKASAPGVKKNTGSATRKPAAKKAKKGAKKATKGTGVKAKASPKKSTVKRGKARRR